jgi:hypothetical protein
VIGIIIGRICIDYWKGWGQNSVKTDTVAKTDVYNVFEIFFVWYSCGRNFVLKDWLDKLMIKIN